MTKPLVSVILPTYNGSRYLAEAIQSVREQSLQDWELILVDDFSDDETPRIINSFVSRDSRIKSIRHASNLRLPAALNNGFALSRGRYLTWTSDDNIYESNALELMARYLDSHSSVSMVYTDLVQIDADGSEIRKWRLSGPENLPNGNCIQACFMYRREVYERLGGYSEDMFLVEDYDYWLRISKEFGIVHLPDVYPYRYRRHEASLTQRRKLDIVRQMARVRARHLVPETARDTFIAECCWKAVWIFMQQGEHGLARSIAWSAIQHAPWNPAYWRTWIGRSISYFLSRLQAKAA